MPKTPGTKFLGPFSEGFRHEMAIFKKSRNRTFFDEISAEKTQFQVWYQKSDLASPFFHPRGFLGARNRLALELARHDPLKPPT